MLSQAKPSQAKPSHGNTNGMISRLVLWEAMGGLFAEHFSVHAVLGRKLNKRSRGGKMSSQFCRGSGFGQYLEEVFLD